jgi:GTP pyrophosphokinase
MVHIKTPTPLNNDGSVDIDAWIKQLNTSSQSAPLIKDACQLARVTGEDQPVKYGTTCFLQGLEIAEILNELQFDKESIAAAIVYSTVKYTDLTIEDIEEQLGEKIARLIKSLQQMSIISKLSEKIDPHSRQQLDNIRKMLLTMVRDVRVVVIKLAERLFIMRSLRHQNENVQRDFAQITMDIFAPLANRLGLHQIKWELEDLAFSYLESKTYKEIAKHLDERRTDRDNRIKRIVETLNENLNKTHIKADVQGRAKHIYSIKRKMQRKNVDFSQIYDATAVRVLVNTTDECYSALSIAHELWKSIPEEFDDYINAPKPNGYQSIHTAVIGPANKNFEIQIRTHKMHEESEKGVAAHWMYKEGKPKQLDYEEKIVWLRNLLDWQKELTHDASLPDELEKSIFEERIYVFTPAGDIIDLPAGSTPLDFAYHIHSEVGHRCRGAKINTKIVPLTYQLKTGDQVEVLTAKNSNPSRDWLITQRGYLKTSTARAKVLQWFKHQDFETHVANGRDTLERELQRLGIDKVNLSEIATKLNYKSADLMLAAFGNNNLRLAQITNLIHAELESSLPTKPEIPTTTTIKEVSGKDHITVQGVGNLLSRLAKCCKPVPGDPIIGYITQGQGVTVHHRDCKNIIYADTTSPDRLIEVQWNDSSQKTYPVDIEIIAYDRQGLVRDITVTMANEKINILNLNFSINKTNNNAKVILTIAISDLSSLSKILDHINQIPNIHSIKRVN